MSDWLELKIPWWEIVLRASIVYFVMLALLRVSGKRTVGQFTPFDPQAARDPRIPGQDLLRAVANGTAVLSDEHRDWCLAEAMVLTGFERTPVQLMEDGEAALAALILSGKPMAA